MSLVRFTVLLGAVLAAAGCGRPRSGGGGPDLPARELLVARASGPLPAEDPLSPAWGAAREVVVPLLLQDTAEPRLLGKGVETVRVRALRDDRRIAFRLSWADAAVDDLTDVDRSTDAAAIQFPVLGTREGIPDSRMGQEGRPVSISFWRASWQRRVEGGSHGVAALYPNAAIDHYPPEAVRDPEARRRLRGLYEPPVAVGNPVARRTITSPVEDLVAEGFGTLSPAPEQRSTGKGVHRDGRWSVVITRPLDPAAGPGASLVAGRSTFFALAVWDGGRNQRGSLKMRSIWVPLVFPGSSP